MAKRQDAARPRVQVYFEDPKIEAALRRDARATKASLSRAAERAIARGLRLSPALAPEDRLLALDRALRGHMRATARDMAIVQELLVEFARAFFARLPDTPADDDPLLKAVIENRIERMIDAAAYRLASAGARGRAQDAAPSDVAPPDVAAAE